MSKPRRRHTVAQAKNSMRRAVDEILDPSPRSVESVWTHFEACCAYCGVSLDPEQREAHIDHADPAGGNQLGNLVLSCGACNGDEKREQGWREFLLVKTKDPEVLAERERRILAWIEKHPLTVPSHSQGVERKRTEIEALIAEFGTKCAELKSLRMLDEHAM
jgi:hypothetical protein